MALKRNHCNYKLYNFYRMTFLRDTAQGMSFADTVLNHFLFTYYVTSDEASDYISNYVSGFLFICI